MVDNWLASYGLSEEHCSRSPGRDWVKVKVPIGLAEKMLDTVSFSPEFADTVLNVFRPVGILCLESHQWRFPCPHDNLQSASALARPHRTDSANDAVFDPPGYEDHVPLRQGKRE